MVLGLVWLKSWFCIGFGNDLVRFSPHSVILHWFLKDVGCCFCCSNQKQTTTRFVWIGQADAGRCSAAFGDVASDGEGAWAASGRRSSKICESHLMPLPHKEAASGGIGSRTPPACHCPLLEI